MIEARNLSKKFGRIAAVDSIDFDIPKGQVVGFLGPNGAGKSTTIRMIAGYLPPTSGRVVVDGLDVVENRLAVQSRIGYLPEAAPSYGEMRVVEFLKFRAKIFGIERAKRNAAIDLAIKRCWLNDVCKRPIHQLSKGYRQRVGLAAALLHQPPVLILDEPTVGLDPSQIREVRGLIRELSGKHTVLLSTHMLPEVELSCDRIIMIARGRVRAQGTIDELRNSAAKTERYIIETDSIRAEAVLREMRGVREVESIPLESRWRRLTVVAADQTGDLREALAAALAKAGGAAREIHRDVPSLEHLFVQMVADAEADYAAQAEGAAA